MGNWWILQPGKSLELLLLEEPLELFGIRGVLICYTKKHQLLELCETREHLTREICEELVNELKNKIDEWKSNIGRIVHICCPFANNPPDLDSPQFIHNVNRWPPTCSANWIKRILNKRQTLFQSFEEFLHRRRHWCHSMGIPLKNWTTTGVSQKNWRPFCRSFRNNHQSCKRSCRFNS